MLFSHSSEYSEFGHRTQRKKLYEGTIVKGHGDYYDETKNCNVINTSDTFNGASGMFR